MKKAFLIFMLLLLTGCGIQESVCEEPSQEALPVEEKMQIFSKTEIAGLSGKRKSWGMRRNIPQRPEFTAEQKQDMDKYGCIYMGAEEKKYVYLTFDEGYENGQTGKILDVLKQKNVSATFFITGDYFKSEIELIDRMVQEGHEVGNHTMNHPCVADLTTEKLEEELLSLDRAFYGRYGKHMSYFRAPEGVYSDKTLAVCKSMGYTSVFWSFAYDDWYRDKTRGKEYALNKTVENIHPGCVILLHAVSRDNAEALGEIIDWVRSEGYEFLPLDAYIS